MAQSNDIVINAKANTKEAEANLQQLEARIKGMTAADPKLQQMGSELGKVSGKVIDANKAIGGGFAALQGSLTGVITKLGAAGLAIGALKKVWDSYWAAQQKTVDSLKAAADANGGYFNALQDGTKNILDNLQKLDQLADGGYLDDNSIQQTNNLVSQLNDLWGDVGITVDQTTGKVNGLADATKKITAELRDMAIRQAKLEEQAAQAALDKAKSDKAWYFDENGGLTSMGAAAIAADIGDIFQSVGGAVTGTYQEQVTNMRRNKKLELEGAEKTAEAALAAAQFKRKQLEDSTTPDDVNNTVQAAQGVAQQAGTVADVDAERAKLIAEEDKMLEDEQKRLAAQTEYIKKTREELKAFDAEEERLKQNLAIAQANGGDVEAAKQTLDNYIENRNTARLQSLQGQLGAARGEQMEAQRRYEQDVANGADDDVIENSMRRLQAANTRLSQITEEMSKLASGVYKPASAPATETARAMANGTFDSYGLNGLTNNPIEQQQLEVQKQIARNTENLNVPIVGE